MHNHRPSIRSNQGSERELHFITTIIPKLDVDRPRRLRLTGTAVRGEGPGGLPREEELVFQLGWEDRVRSLAYSLVRPGGGIIPFVAGGSLSLIMAGAAWPPWGHAGVTRSRIFGGSQGPWPPYPACRPGQAGGLERAEVKLGERVREWPRPTTWARGGARPVSLSLPVPVRPPAAWPSKQKSKKGSEPQASERHLRQLQEGDFGIKLNC